MSFDITFPQSSIFDIGRSLENAAGSTIFILLTLLFFAALPSHAATGDFCSGLASITAAAAEDFRPVAEWKSDSSGKDVFMDTTVELPNSTYSHVLRFGTGESHESFPPGTVIYKTWMYRYSDDLDDGIISNYRQVVADVRKCLPAVWKQEELTLQATKKMHSDETLSMGTSFTENETATVVEIRLSKIGSYQIIFIARRSIATAVVAEPVTYDAAADEFCSAVETILRSVGTRFAELKGSYHGSLLGGKEYYGSKIKLPAARTTRVVPVHDVGEEPEYQLKCDMLNGQSVQEVRNAYKNLGVQLRQCLDDGWEKTEIPWSDNYKTTKFTRFENRGTSSEKKTKILLSVQTRENQPSSLEIIFLPPG